MQNFKLLVLLTSLLTMVGSVLADPVLPTGGTIVEGYGSISQKSNSMTITQTTGKMSADWQTFNIGTGNSVNFVQPSASSIALNRVLGSNVSLIQGKLTANGQVFLINPNGVLFTPTAQVNVNGLVASTLNITHNDFMAGKLMFSGDSSSAIINQGNINAHEGGTVALIAARITNSGALTANSGDVLIGAAAKVVLDLGGPYKLQVTQGAIDALIENGGGIKADGGVVYLIAKAASDLAISTVINNTGVIEAQTLATGKAGQISLIGGLKNDRIVIDGTLDASAPNGADGGFIETSAAQVNVMDSVKVTTSALQGSSGTWLIDPVDYTIAAVNPENDSSYMSNVTLSNSLKDNNVIIETLSEGSGNGDIFVNDTVSWNTNKLTLNAHRNININTVMTADGTSTLALNTGNGNDVNMGLNASGFIGRVDIPTRTGTDILSINGVDYTVIQSLGTSGDASASPTVMTLQGMAVSANLDGNFALGTNINATGTSSWNSEAGFTPIGSNAASFTGTFEGLGHTVSSLTINRTSAPSVGLFGNATGSSTIGNIGLVGGTVVGAAGTGGLIGATTTTKVLNSYATGTVMGAAGTGGLIGAISTGSISNSYALGNVSGAAGAGGLIGAITTGSISNSYALGNVSGAAGTGGLAGTTTGTIGYSYATGTVNGAAGTGGLAGTTTGTIGYSYATGTVTGGAGTGGLAGTTTGTIGYSYATGTVAGGAGTGGLAGTATGNISNSYAAGSATAVAAVDGIAGSSTGTISNTFWDSTKNMGISITAATSKTSTEMNTPTTFGAWNFIDNWFMNSGSSSPVLRGLMTSLTVTALDFNKTYNGSAYSGGNGVILSLAGSTPAGTLGYAGSAQGAVNVGNYTITPTGYISNQQYLINYVDGALTIAAIPTATAIPAAISPAVTSVLAGIMSITPVAITTTSVYSVAVSGDAVSVVSEGEGESESEGEGEGE